MDKLLINTVTTLLTKEKEKRNQGLSFDIQGHRGCRGLMPENTIQGFIEALKMGVHTLDMDVVLTGDGELVVSHDLFISPERCLNFDGSMLDPQQVLNIYNMTYEEVKEFDCGRKINAKFPMQKSMGAVKPLLSEVINRIEKYILWNSYRSVQYNIEIRTSPDGDHIYHPKPEELVLKVYDLLRKRNLLHRCIIQSADVRPLQLFKRIAPQLQLSLLVENDCTMEDNIEALGFNPTVYSPSYLHVDSSLIKRVHSAGMKIIPWTVNEILDMNELMQMGVDGIVTDYPDIALKLVEN